MIKSVVLIKFWNEFAIKSVINFISYVRQNYRIVKENNHSLYLVCVNVNSLPDDVFDVFDKKQNDLLNH